MLVMFVLFDRFGMENVLLEMLHDSLSAAGVSASAESCICASAARFCRHRIDRRVHVVGLFTGLDRDVIRANQDDLRGVPVFLHLENDVRLDDLRIIEMQAFDFPRAVIIDRSR